MRRALFVLALVGCSPAPAPVACLGDHECSSDEACVDGACTPREDAGRQDAGPCATSRCECATSADCPAVAACADSLCEANVCRVVERHERCAPLGICESAVGCVSPGDAGAQDGGTDAGSDAGTPEVDAGPPPDEVGDACAAASDCSDLGSNAQCAMRAGLTTASFPGGYCTLPCTEGSSPCSAGAICWTRFFTMGMCLRECTADSDCRSDEGYVCGQPREGMLERPSSTCVPSDLAR